MRFIMEQKKINRKRLLGFVLLIIGLCGGWLEFCFYIKTRAENSKKDALISALSSGMHQYRNKLGQQVTERRAVQISYADLKKIHASDSSQIGQLKKLVKKNTIAAVAFTAVTSGTLSGTKPGVTFGTKTDSLTKLTVVDSCKPTFRDTLTDAWGTFYTCASADSTSIEYTIKNEFSFTQDLKKEGKWPFRKNYLDGTITNKNPHTVTKDIIVYHTPVPDHKKRNTIVATGLFFLGLLAGFKIAN